MDKKTKKKNQIKSNKTHMQWGTSNGMVLHISGFSCDLIGSGTPDNNNDTEGSEYQT